MKSTLGSTTLLLIGLLISSAVAYAWPATWSDAWSQWYVEREWVHGFWDNRLLALVAGTMFAIGTLLTVDEVRAVRKRWPTVLGGTAIQYTAMPFLAWMVGRLWGLDGPSLVGVIMVGCVPGAMASNVLTLAAGGNTSYSVSLTTLATLISPVVVPFTLWWALGESVQINPLHTSLTLTITVVVPVVLGYSVRRTWPGREIWFTHVSPLVANAAILLIIALVVAANRELLGQVSVPLLMPLWTINLGGFLIGYGGAWAMNLPEPMRRALTLEIGMQNAGLGAALAARLFTAEASVAPALYTFGCMLTGTLLAWLWARRGERGEA